MAAVVGALERSPGTAASKRPEPCRASSVDLYSPLHPSQALIALLRRASSFSPLRLVFRLASWAVICWLVVFWRLDFVSLIDDEAHYAQLTREMREHASWLVPMLDGAPYIDKPILFHWLQGLAFGAFGENEFAASLPSALAALMLFAGTAYFARRLIGPAIAERAWLLLATVPATFVLSRVGYLDMLFTALLAYGVGSLLIAAIEHRPRLQYIGAVALTLAVLTKGPVALALVTELLVLGWLAGGACRRVVRTLEWKRVFTLVVLASAPWFVWMHGRFGDAFIRDYFLLGHLWYLQPRASASSVSQFFYPQMFITAFLPWSIVTVGYFIDTVRNWRTGSRPPVVERFLWLWIASVLLLFTAARFRVDRYIFPAAPACCLLAARGWLSARTAATARPVIATRVAILTVAVILIGLSIVLAVRLPSLGLDLPRSAFLLPAALAFGGLATAVPMLRSGLRPPVIVHAPVWAMVLVYALVVSIGFPVLERARPVKQVGEWLRHRSQSDDAVGLYNLDRWQPPLRFYGARRLKRLDTGEEARAFLAAPGPGWLVTRRDALEALVGPDGTAGVRLTVPAVIGTSGQLVRDQVWGDVVVVERAQLPEQDSDEIPLPAPPAISDQSSISAAEAETHLEPEEAEKPAVTVREVTPVEAGSRSKARAAVAPRPRPNDTLKSGLAAKPVDRGRGRGLRAGSLP